MNWTLSQLKQRVRERSDNESGGNISDTELTTYINHSIAALYDVLIQNFEAPYFLKETTINLVKGTETYALPADFYKIYAVDYKSGNNKYVTMQEFQLYERNFQFATNPFFITEQPLRYKLWDDSNIRISPADRISSGFTVRVFYIPVAPALSLDADTMKGFNGYEEFVVIDSAIKILTKQGLETNVLYAQKRDIERRIVEAAANRDIGKTGKVQLTDPDWC